MPRAVGVDRTAEAAEPEAESARAGGKARAHEVLTRLGAYVPALVASAVVGTLAVHGIVARAGHPAVPLDDAFIHFQYARRLAEGGFFSYVRGEGYTTGATSLLWPLVLAPFHLLGARGLSLVWVAWLFGGLGHAAVAVETKRLAEPLTGRTAAIAAGAMASALGAFAWFAWSGMETIFLAWILLRTARVAAERCESPRPGAFRELAVLGLLAPLIRPEGALASVLAAFALALRPSAERHPLAARARALVPLAGPLVIPLLHLALAGHARSSTTEVKWLVGNPSFEGHVLPTVLGNVRLLLENILDGGDWTALFLPEGSRVPILLGLALLPVAAARHRRPHRALFIAAVALGALGPCTYLSFLWNRLRYVWPFAGAWIVLAACFAREAGDLARLLARRLGARRAAGALRFVTPLLAFGMVGALATKLPWTLRDLAQSAHAIDRQQVKLARWADASLPADARIGVNDTGAVAYLGGRPTFDVVGLTTEGEARYWVAGAGSRFEHYEHLPRERLPSHFIVYPHWMACPPVLGRVLTQATVTDQSILGGATMVAYEARWDLLGSGHEPVLLARDARVVDELDVADLESEAAHAFDRAGAIDADDVAVLLETSAGELAEGGRLHRGSDRFVARVTPGARLVLRVGADERTHVEITAADREVGSLEVPAVDFTELAVDLPASIAGERVPIEVRASGRAFTSYHYWVVDGP
jgi:hypothetical protein